jgi:hypothetical protein
VTTTELPVAPKPSRSKKSKACVPANTPCRSTVTVMTEASDTSCPEVETPEIVTCGAKKTSPVCWRFSRASVTVRPVAVPTSGVMVLASSRATSKASGGWSVPFGANWVLRIVN